VMESDKTFLGNDAEGQGPEVIILVIGALTSRIWATGSLLIGHIRATGGRLTSRSRNRHYFSYLGIGRDGEHHQQTKMPVVLFHIGKSFWV